MQYLYAFLVFTFIVHAIAFTVLGVRRQKPYYFCLTGTFVFLTCLYLIKYFGITAAVPGTSISLVLLFRVLALVMTFSYLVVISRIPGSWLNRLIQKCSRS